MKDKQVKELPKCDFCKARGNDRDAIYDAPTVAGSWANMCQEDYDCYSRGSMGTKFVLFQAEESTTTEILNVIENTSLEDVIMGGELRRVECPECGFEHPMEPDADGVFNCHGCKVKLRMRDMCFG